MGTKTTAAKWAAITLLVVAIGMLGGCAPAAPVKPFAIVIDNSSEKGFETKGDWTSDNAEGGGNYESDSLWCYDNAEPSDVAYWKPDLPYTGTYKVWIWYCGDPNLDHATKAPFYVKAADKTYKFEVNLQQNDGKWNELGTFRFKKGSKTNCVYVTSSPSGNVVADAVKFEYVGK